MEKNRNFYIWLIGATLWGTLCFVLPDFMDNPMEGWRGILTQGIYVSACGIGNLFFLYLIGCNKYVCAAFLPIYGIGGAAVSFYRMAFRVTITPMLIDAVLHTNSEEAFGVISWQLVCWLLFNIAVAITLCIIRFKLTDLNRAWLHALVVLVLGTGYLLGYERLRISLRQRYPYNVCYNMHLYKSLQRTIAEERIVPAYTAQEVPDSLTIVLVIGEALRADHLNLNGYWRETTPLLSKRTNLISFPHIYSEETHTLASVPHMLTRADSVHSEYQDTETSFVPILRKEGFRTIWISNQDLGTSFVHFLAECDTNIFANAGKSDYVYSPWLDEELLPILDTYDNNTTARNVYILHTIGSHWYYNNHVPERHYFYQPITSNRLITNNSIEQITNSYDNSIRYMDEFMDSLITRFEHRNAIIIYQSDHGEALGEDGTFLHANDVPSVKNPACIMWFSDAFAQRFPDKVRALQANQLKHYRTDYLFYSILNIANITAEGQSPAVNIFDAQE